MKKILHALSVSALLFTGAAFAQAKGDMVIYKYNDGKGKASYSQVPPHNESNFDTLKTTAVGYLNDMNDAPSHLRPAAPTEPVVRPKPIAVKEDKPKEEVVEGTISREQRCKDAQSDITLLKERQTIYEEDKSGNLVPLSPEQAEQRLKQAEEIVAKVCQ